MASNKTLITAVNSDSVSCDNSDLAVQRFVVSYNLHGFNQGYAGIRDLKGTLSPAVIMVREHWSYPGNLSKLDNLSDE